MLSKAIEAFESKSPLGVEGIETIEFNSLSFIMAKPDSRKDSLDIVIEDILENQKFDLPGLTETDVENLSKIRVAGRFSLRLTPESSVLDFVYEDETKDRSGDFLNRLKTFYTGDVTFYVIVSCLQQDELEPLLNRLKGNKTLLNDAGDVIKQPVGIRGKFLNPGKVLNFSDPETKNNPELYVNLLHTSDNLTASKRILQLYLQNSSCKPTEKVRAKLVNFLNEHNESSTL